MDNDHILIGKIVGVWGVKGWLKIHSYTRNRIEIAEYPLWLLKKKQERTPRLQSVKVLNCRQQGQGMVAQIEDVNDREQAQKLIGKSILINRNELPALPQGQYYWQQLIGLSVFDKDKQLIGKLDSILETGANDVLVVRQKNADVVKEVLIPYTTEVVLEVNLAQNAMIVDWDPVWLD